MQVEPVADTQQDQHERMLARFDRDLQRSRRLATLGGLLCYKSKLMIPFCISFLACLSTFFRSRYNLSLEILALRQQLGVLQRKQPRSRLRIQDRMFWILLIRRTEFMTLLKMIHRRCVLIRPSRINPRVWLLSLASVACITDTIDSRPSEEIPSLNQNLSELARITLADVVANTRITKGEEARLLAAAREPYRKMILVAIYTGLHLAAEIFTLRWENIDLERGHLTVEGAHSKNHETQTLPLSKKVVKALKAIRKTSRSDHVFVNRQGKPFGSVRTAFTTACRRANLSGVSPHVLRHTFATRLREEGVSDGTIQALGQWKEPKMVRRYAHMNNEVMKKALEQIAKNSPAISITPQEGETRKSLCARSSVG